MIFPAFLNGTHTHRGSHFHREDAVYYLVHDVNQAENKNKIIDFFESNWYDKRESRWRQFHYNKMIYVKKLED